MNEFIPKEWEDICHRESKHGFESADIPLFVEQHPLNGRNAKENRMALWFAAQFGAALLKFYPPAEINLSKKSQQCWWTTCIFTANSLA